MEPEEPGELVTPRSGEGFDIVCRTVSHNIREKYILQVAQVKTEMDVSRGHYTIYTVYKFQYH